MRDSSAIAGALDREAFAVVVGLTLVALAVAPRNASALTALLALALAPVLLWALRTRPIPSMSRSTAVTLTIINGAALVLAAATFGAADPRVSWFGVVGQHSGALLWVGLGVLVTTGVMFSRPGDPGRVARTIGVAGAVLAIAGLLDAAGLMRAARLVSEPAGLLEDHLSLAQSLIVPLACCIAWALSRAGRERIVAWACALLCGVCLLVTTARGAWVGVVVGAAFAVVYLLVSRRRAIPPAWAAGACVLAIGVVLGGVWMLANGPSSPVMDWFVEASNGRATFWRSAFALAAAHPVFGSGPEQFTAWVSWTSNPGVDLNRFGTTDPHNVVLYWLLAAGIPGLLALLGSVFVSLRSVFAGIAQRGNHAGLIAMVAGVVGYGASLLYAWTGPLAATFAAVCLGALLASSSSGDGSSVSLGGWRPRVVLGTLIALVLCAAIPSSSIVAAEYAWARAADAGGTDPAAMRSAALATRDPFFAVAAVSAYTAAATADSGNARTQLDEVAALRPVLENAAGWNVEAAYELQEYLVARAMLLGEKDWPATESALERGKEADPTSGLWDYVAAVCAGNMGEDAAAREHAEAALRYPVSDEVRTWLEGVAGGTR